MAIDKQLRKPDFFIVGAAKSGTTAMHEYLKQHPDIFMTERKDIGFFGRDLTFTELTVRDRDFDSYLQTHFAAASHQKRAGESSVTYLLSTTAAEEIAQHVPDADIIIMLRNPVEMVYSLYYQNRFNGSEDLPTFDAALAAEADRKQGHKLPRTGVAVDPLFYREVARYSLQVQRYFQVFGRERVHVIVYDDFRADTLQAYRDTLCFLGVDANHQPEFKIINPNKEVRSTALMRLYKHPFVYKVARRLPGLAQRVYGVVRQFNTRPAHRPPISSTAKQELQAVYAPDIQQLGTLLNRDLSHWITTEKQPYTTDN